MVDLDPAGIKRSAKALGGEGTVVLLLRTGHRYEVEVLDAALPEDRGDSPANGGWFQGPTGWLLLVEGLEDQVTPWLDDLAAGLTAAGVEGTVTGAGTSLAPKWARQMDTPSLYALVGFRPRPGFDPRDAWTPGPDALTVALEYGMGWLTAHDAELLVRTGMGATFRVEPAAAAQLMTGNVERFRRGSCSSFDRPRLEERGFALSPPAAITLSVTTERIPRTEQVDALRAALLAAPLDRVSIAMVSHRHWGILFGVPIEGGDYHGYAYDLHPERWDEFTLDPCGIQILTDRHLAAAHDLSGWRTTRLDDTHHLVEARDLDPWFATPRRDFEPLPPELIDPARRDFGAMILTRQRAEELDLTTPPPRP